MCLETTNNGHKRSSFCFDHDLMGSDVLVVVVVVVGGGGVLVRQKRKRGTFELHEDESWFESWVWILCEWVEGSRNNPCNEAVF